MREDRNQRSRSDSRSRARSGERRSAEDRQYSDRPYSAHSYSEQQNSGRRYNDRQYSNGADRSYDDRQYGDYRTGEHRNRSSSYDYRDSRSEDGFYRESDNGNRSRGKNSRGAKKKKKRVVALIILEIIILLLIAGGAFAFFYVQNLWDKVETPAFQKKEVQTNEDLPQSVVESSKGYTTILLYGVDARNNKDLTKNANADTDIICSINNDTGEIKLVSVLRDTLVETTTGKHTKLTNVYAGYGVQESLETINRNFDLNITEYVTVNWYAVAETIDLMGGLDVEMSAAEASAINNYIDETAKTTGFETSHVEVYDGVHHLDGVQTTTYARVRSVGHHDITRAERQRKVISLMLEKAKTMSLSTLNSICNTVFPNISTNLTLTEVLGLATDIGKYNIVEQTLFPFRYVDQTQGGDYVYCKELTDNVAELHELLYGNTDYEPSATVRSISEYITEYRYDHP